MTRKRRRSSIPAKADVTKVHSTVPVANDVKTPNRAQKQLQTLFNRLKPQALHNKEGRKQWEAQKTSKPATTEPPTPTLTAQAMKKQNKASKKSLPTLKKPNEKTHVNQTSKRLHTPIDHLPIYTEEELRIGQGGGTPLCPFDCQCCF